MWEAIKTSFFGCATDRPTSRESLNDLLFSMRSRGERNGMRSFSNTREHLKPWWRVKCTVSRANANDVTVSDLFAGHFRNSRYSWIMGHLRHLQFVFWLILNVFQIWINSNLNTIIFPRACEPTRVIIHIENIKLTPSPRSNSLACQADHQPAKTRHHNFPVVCRKTSQKDGRAHTS